MPTISSEILINAKQVESHGQFGDIFEFILNQDLHVLECVKIESLSKGVIMPVQDLQASLHNLLFELNHVRVNPRLDNTKIIDVFTQALNEIGVKVGHQPKANDMAVCFKPVGEISDSVRFYLDGKGKLIFLSPSLRPRLITGNRR